MTARPHFSSLSRRCRRFAADRRGASAVEFALLLPLMLTMYFGSLEVTDAISADRQVTLVASTVAEIASQYPSVASADTNNILSAASSVLTPFPLANATVTLSSVLIDVNSNATVDWSCTVNGTARANNAVVTTLIPSGLLIANTSVLWGEVTYNYKPMLGYTITGTLKMYDQIFLRPRQSSSVPYTNPLASGCNG
jgi:Flp pilus assembly protein TadG